MRIVFDATLEGLSTRMDNTIKVTIGTQEMNPEQAASLFGLRGKFIKVLFSDSAIEQKEVEAVNSLELKDTSKIKSNSQRLRNTLYLLWQQSGNSSKFDDYYNGSMNTIIEHFKSKLQK